MNARLLCGATYMYVGQYLPLTTTGVVTHRTDKVGPRREADDLTRDESDAKKSELRLERSEKQTSIKPTFIFKSCIDIQTIVEQK